eukprot:m.261439 g.261439  ORF g.261439 m.261439 type:complete len:809 (+) comp42159_c0_seq1:124-2550(+)
MPNSNRDRSSTSTPPPMMTSHADQETVFDHERMVGSDMRGRAMSFGGLPAQQDTQTLRFQGNDYRQAPVTLVRPDYGGSQWDVSDNIPSTPMAQQHGPPRTLATPPPGSNPMHPGVWYYLASDQNVDGVDGRSSAPVPGMSYTNMDNGLRNRSTTKTPQPLLERHKEVNNFLFGMKKWKGTLTKRPLDERSAEVQELYAPVTSPKKSRGPNVSIGNIIYVILFGWWLSLVYVIVGALLYVSILGKEYSLLCWDLAGYFLWPFGKYVIKEGNASQYGTESLPLLNDKDAVSNSQSVSPTDLDEKIDKCRPSFWIWAMLSPILFISHSIVVLICGFLVVYIPMAKIQWRNMCQIMFYNPVKIRVVSNIPSQRGTHILMCTFQAANPYYYKYTVEGMNIVLVNCMIFVLMAILFGFIEPLHDTAGHEFVFALSTVSIVPLAYYIGMSIANISAQSGFAVGALLNATFGSVVEIILYYFSLKKGLRKLVKASLTGTLLATMLFIPGICMVIGGLKFEQQHFNLRSAGVSSSLLFVSVAGAYSPSLFQQTFGQKSMTCTNLDTPGIGVTFCNATDVCRCSWRSLDDEELETDVTYESKTRKLVWFCAALLPLAYIIGLVYTLRTHSHRIFIPLEPDEEDNTAGGHSQHGPIWSKLKAITILLVSTGLLAVVAELVVSSVEPIIEEYGISEEAMGLVVIALLPDVAEIVNGIQFARQNNIALSIEIGSSIAVQVCMLQMPVLVFMSEIFLTQEVLQHHFTLVFPDMHVYAVIFSVILMNYTFQDGKSDYFQGSILLITYTIMCGILLFAPPMDK